MIDILVKEFNLNKDSIINIYSYGSRVYETNHDKSDYDFIIVMDENSIDQDSMASSDKNINCIIYKESSWIKLIKEHKIFALECIFLPEDKILQHKKDYSSYFTLNLSVHRKYISEKVSNSWVKGKKKFEVEKDRDIYIGKKSLFHSLRIIDFAIQICKYGKIIDFTSSNKLWKEIYNNASENWNDYHKLYHGYFNSQMTEFRKLAPK
ncbi:MAG: nucleotidyltransferase domain-containing protein [Chitinophagales bacterium]|nr:nucleotidyltransferase domain-containing protein [Chitinophagales bacterium]